MGLFDKRYAFRVEIDGITQAAFTTAGPLEATTEEVMQAEGGALSDNKEPGKVVYAPITLTKGATDNRELYEWWKAVNQDGTDDFRDITLVQTDRAGNETRRYDCFDTWPMRGKFGEWDAAASENNIEEIELSVGRIERVDV